MARVKRRGASIQSIDPEGKESSEEEQEMNTSWKASESELSKRTFSMPRKRQAPLQNAVPKLNLGNIFSSSSVQPQVSERPQDGFLNGLRELNTQFKQQIEKSLALSEYKDLSSLFSQYSKYLKELEKENEPEKSINSEEMDTTEEKEEVKDTKAVKVSEEKPLAFNFGGKSITENSKLQESKFNFGGKALPENSKPQEPIKFNFGSKELPDNSKVQEPIKFNFGGTSMPEKSKTQEPIKFNFGSSSSSTPFTFGASASSSTAGQPFSFNSQSEPSKVSAKVDEPSESKESESKKTESELPESKSTESNVAEAKTGPQFTFGTSPSSPSPFSFGSSSPQFSFGSNVSFSRGTFEPSKLKEVHTVDSEEGQDAEDNSVLNEEPKPKEVEAVAQEESDPKEELESKEDLVSKEEQESIDIDEEKSESKPKIIDTGVGEENETTICQSRAKIYIFEGEWKDLGVVNIKVNESESKKRLLARSESTGKLLLNVYIDDLTKATLIKNQVNFICFVDRVKKYSFKLKTVDEARELSEAAQAK